MPCRSVRLTKRNVQKVALAEYTTYEVATWFCSANKGDHDVDIKDEISASYPRTLGSRYPRTTSTDKSEVTFWHRGSVSV